MLPWVVFSGLASAFCCYLVCSPSQGWNAFVLPVRPPAWPAKNTCEITENKDKSPANKQQYPVAQALRIQRTPRGGSRNTGRAVPSSPASEGVAEPVPWPLSRRERETQRIVPPQGEELGGCRRSAEPVRIGHWRCSRSGAVDLRESRKMKRRIKPVAV